MDREGVDCRRLAPGWYWRGGTCATQLTQTSRVYVTRCTLRRRIPCLDSYIGFTWEIDRCWEDDIPFRWGRIAVEKRIASSRLSKTAVIRGVLEVEASSANGWHCWYSHGACLPLNRVMNSTVRRVSTKFGVSCVGLSILQLSTTAIICSPRRHWRQL